jgi:putative copper export protein
LRTPAGDPAPPLRLLARSVSLELGLAAVILLVTAVLSTTEAPGF